MKYDIKLKIIGSALLNLISKDIKDKKVLKKIKEEYKAVLLRAKPIGKNSNLLVSYAFGAFFIAMNRNTKLTPEENYNIIYNNMKNNKLVTTFIGNSDDYFSEKGMKKRKKLEEESQKRIYENDWVFKLVEKTDKFDLGFDYYECGICKMCQQEGCFEWAKYLCRFDYLIFGIQGIQLDRTMTIANGNEKCDFRLTRKR